MPQTLITERYAADIAGVLNCYDRVVISGQLAPICYAKGMTKYLYVQGMLIFDYTKFAQPLRDAIRQNAATIAAAAGLEIEFITKQKSFRKEDRIRAHYASTGCSPRTGAHFFGNGNVPGIRTLARQRHWGKRISE
jgi:hypothetical protein